MNNKKNKIMKTLTTIKEALLKLGLILLIIVCNIGIHFYMYFIPLFITSGGYFLYDKTGDFSKFIINWIIFTGFVFIQYHLIVKKIKKQSLYTFNTAIDKCKDMISGKLPLQWF